jgi:hypothetical protein
MAGLARAAQSATQAARLVGNAATQYWAAFHLLPVDSLTTKVLFRWSNTPLNAEATQVINAGRASLSLLSQGAAAAKCDWKLDYSRGPGTLLPQLNQGRVLAQLACLRARMEFKQHHPTEAIDDLTNVMALAEHLSTDKTLIGSLVRDRIEEMATEILTPHLQQLDKPALDHLAQRMLHVPAGSTVIEIFQMESRLRPGWAIAQAQKAAAIGEPMDWGPLRDDLNPNGQPALASVANATPEDIVIQGQALLPYFVTALQLVQASTDQGTTEMALKRLFTQYASKPLAAIFVIDLTRSFDRYAAGRTSLTMLQAAIAVIKDGPDRVKNFSDPINHQPLTYRKTAGGFELISTVTHRDQPVTLRIISMPIQ